MNNIALIVLDTLRKDAFDKHFDWLPGTRYENAWSTSHYTVPAHGSLVSGLYPSQSGCHAKSEGFDTIKTNLISELSRAGYKTRAYSANTLLSINGFGHEFQEFDVGGQAMITDDDVIELKTEIENAPVDSVFIYPYILSRVFSSKYSTSKSFKYIYKTRYDEFNTAREATNYAREASFGDDEFLFMNIMDAHSAHDDSNYFGQEDEHRGCWQTYQANVKQLSQDYRQLFHLLTENFEYIITISDHGELFGEHGFCKHWHGLYPELTQVPVCVYGPEFKNDSSLRLTSLVDVHKTVAEIAGLDIDSEGTDLRKSRDSPCWTEYHGVRPSQIDTLREKGVKKRKIENVDLAMCGISKRDSYVFESVDGLVPESMTDTAAEDQIHDRTSSITQEAIDELSQKEVSEDVLETLKNLGYA